MSFTVARAGLFTIVQDLGRWGYLSRGVTVSDPMDRFSLLIGNAMLGNDRNDAALEIAFLGPEIVFRDERCVVLVGADLGMSVDGEPAAAWTVRRVVPGSRLTVGGAAAAGCRAYLCVSGGIDVPVLMRSRSTYARAGLGGYEGRALRRSDVVGLGEPRPLWRFSEGFSCPPELRPCHSASDWIDALDGPQVDAFTENGVGAFYGGKYIVAGESDRMGYRLDGPLVEHRGGSGAANIISDAVVHGAVQVPADGRPIVMMSDCQTIGGYAKIAVLTAWSAAALAQRAPGAEIRFRNVDEAEAVGRLKKFELDLERVIELRASYRSRRWGPGFTRRG
jgi:biotin-dependent carboxylase-like uncharacterized protein